MKRCNYGFDFPGRKFSPVMFATDCKLFEGEFSVRKARKTHNSSRRQLRSASEGKLKEKRLIYGTYMETRRRGGGGKKSDQNADTEGLAYLICKQIESSGNEILRAKLENFSGTKSSFPREEKIRALAPH